MNTEQQLNQVEMSIEEARKDIEMKDTLIRMDNNLDWQKIVLDGYFKDEAARLVLLKADYGVQDPEVQKDIMKSIDAIGYFRRYLGAIMQKGYAAENGLRADEETREELLSEGLS